MAGGIDIGPPDIQHVVTIFGIPPEFQPAIPLLGLLVAAVIVGYRYATKFLKPSPPSPSPEVQVVAGALADRAAMERLAETLDRIGDLLEDFIEQQDRHHAADDLTLLHRRLDELMRRPPS